MVLLGGHGDDVDDRHLIVRLARLIWLVTRQGLAERAPGASVEPADDSWAEGGSWQQAPCALALVSPREVLAVNDRARALLEENVGRDGAAWQTWLLGAVQRLDLSGLPSDVLVASRSRGRYLEVTLGAAGEPGAPRLVSLSAQAELRGPDLADQEAVLRTLGHELRTPLTAMKTSLSLVLRGDAGPLTAPQQKLPGRHPAQPGAPATACCATCWTPSAPRPAACWCAPGRGPGRGHAPGPGAVRGDAPGRRA